VRNPVIRLADTEQDIQSTTPDHLAIAATLESGPSRRSSIAAARRAARISGGRSTAAMAIWS
jgi:hypothetical protein